MDNLLQQLKQRRLSLGLKQNDMVLRIGVSRQQYQRLESKGNPRLETLELVAKGLNSEIMLIPKEKLTAVLVALEEQTEQASTVEYDSESQSRRANSEKGNASNSGARSHSNNNKSLSDDPWQDLLGEQLHEPGNSSKSS